MLNSTAKIEKQDATPKHEGEILIPFGRGAGLKLPAIIWQNRRQLLALRKLIDSQLSFIGKDEEKA